MLSLEESLKILKETKALLEGHFILSSGLHSPKYVQCAQLMSKPYKANKLCKSLAEKIKYLQNAVGSVPSPFDCYMIIRSIKTLAVRMEKHNSNAKIISQFLNTHDKVTNVRYPGLKTDPNHEIAKLQMPGFGGIMSIELNTNLSATIKFLENIF